jgi:hypothetical protein
MGNENEVSWTSIKEFLSILHWQQFSVYLYEILFIYLISLSGFIGNACIRSMLAFIPKELPVLKIIITAFILGHSFGIWLGPATDTFLGICRPMKQVSDDQTYLISKIWIEHSQSLCCKFSCFRSVAWYSSHNRNGEVMVTCIGQNNRQIYRGSTVTLLQKTILTEKLNYNSRLQLVYNGKCAS